MLAMSKHTDSAWTAAADLKAMATRSNRGFTLTELLVVLAVMSVLLAIGYPMLQDMIRSQQMKTTANDFFATIGLTRSEAIMRGQRVIMAPQASAPTDWSQGWVVFVDRNHDQRPDPADELIFQHGPVSAGIVIRSAFSSGNAAPYIAYNGSGRSCSAANSLAAHWGSLSLASGKHARNIKINMLGRVRICDPVAQPANCSGVADD